MAIIVLGINGKQNISKENSKVKPTDPLKKSIVSVIRTR